MVPMKMQEWLAGPTFFVHDVVDDTPYLEGSLTPPAETKRKRTSKPKVRTGCITCKIRRVKCDETKPACTRCSSTGRKCDGYDGNAPLRRKKSKSPSPPSITICPSDITISQRKDHHHKAAATRPHHEPGQHVFSVASSHDNRRSSSGNSSNNSSSQPRPLRPLAADIPSTPQEREFFHRFWLAADHGLQPPAIHVPGVEPGFWLRLAAQLGSTDRAVRHALIALGAAYESIQQQQKQQQQQQQQEQWIYPTATTTSTSTSTSSPLPTPSSSISSSTSIDNPELFTIQQYNLSIYHLQRHVQPGAPLSSVEVTLVCCLVFVCIETSRCNDDAALAHVVNGLQIIRGLPPDNSNSTTTTTSTAAMAREHSISRADWQQLLGFFLVLGPSAETYILGDSSSSGGISGNGNSLPTTSYYPFMGRGVPSHCKFRWDDIIAGDC
ncbi:uncharacterized protein GGS25DRAFT_17386 [Hypoxylon fragiforme]|uniref:uncharacterized protein n=1 Tax=Hypoxylon fragiforme TaxID=63214 RepID=UPI0020C70096|nr:uncharacterized protein GGS25DRAFT_17386 [Hypoxylon fragiforme]KAI2613794.1 hypothetical protein GGS25DRAFT_17386 [Hypoxylon fragiforme]